MSARKDDPTFDRIVREIADEKNIDRRVVRYVIMGYYKQIKNIIEAGDLSDYDSFIGIPMVNFGLLEPISKKKIDDVKRRSDKMKKDLQSKKENKE